MHGSAAVTGTMIAPGVNSVDPALQARPLPFSVDAARRLMSEAGLPAGFSVTLDCPNDRYVNDAQVCQAVAVMLAQINIRVTVNAMPSSRFFPKIGSRDTSFAFFGYSPVNLDAYNTLNVILETPGPQAGQWNVGQYSNPRIDALIRSALSEMDPQRRMQYVADALTIHRTEMGHVPLFQQGLSWGMRRSLDIPLQIDNRVNLSYATVR